MLTSEGKDTWFGNFYEMVDDFFGLRTEIRRLGWIRPSGFQQEAKTFFGFADTARLIGKRSAQEPHHILLLRLLFVLGDFPQALRR